MKTHMQIVPNLTGKQLPARALKWLPLPLLLAAAPWATAQPYSLGGYTIAGGGGSSSGGPYTVSGTVGQPAAGKLTGGSYDLLGGFWGLAVVVQTPGTPYLTLTRDPLTGAVTVAWPASDGGFTLDQTPALAPPPTVTPWTPISSGYQTNATHISVTLPASVGNGFFRLRKP